MVVNWLDKVQSRFDYIIQSLTTPTNGYIFISLIRENIGYAPGELS